MHSHLLPGIDDGVENYEEAVEVIRKLMAAGYKKLITTPHIMGDFYKNTPEIIYDKLDKLRDIAATMGLDVELDAAAEYYLDEWFVRKLKTDEPLMSFGKKKYVLFETSYMNASPYFDLVVFSLKSKGYTPVLAHPERYVYLFDKPEKLRQMYDTGVLFQININALSGYYSRASQKIAEKLIDNNMLAFLGTDCHGRRHLKHLEKARKTEAYKRALHADLLNNSL